FFILVFFFQAEDGIRDRNVTGVQTCALPICCTCVYGSIPPGILYPSGRLEYLRGHLQLKQTTVVLHGRLQVSSSASHADTSECRMTVLIMRPLLSDLQRSLCLHHRKTGRHICLLLQ